MRFPSCLIILAALVLASCSSKQGGTASLTLHIPTAEQLSSRKGQQKVTADWSTACFMANITGDGIEAPQKSKCDLPSGLFAGSTAPGTQLTVPDVPKGTARKIEIFAYFRTTSTGACAQHKSINEMDPASVASLGVTVADLQNDTNDVTVDITLPATGQSLVTQYNLPSFCSAGSAAPGDGSSRILTARSTSSTAHFKVESVVTGLSSGPLLKTASGIQVRLSHEAKDKDAP